MYQRFSLSLQSAAVFAVICILALVSAVSVRAAAPLAGSTIGNQASATYTDSSNTTHTATSNVTLTVIQQVASLTLTSDQTRAAAVGSQVVFPHTLINTGNGADTFTLSLSQLAGDNFDLTGAAIYADANGDGLPDSATAITSTGLIAAGARFQLVVVGTVPGGQSASQTGQMRTTATSTFTPATNATNTDTATVSANGVVQVTESLSSSSGASPSGPYTVTLTFSNTGNNTATNFTLTDTPPAGFNYVPGSARWSVSGATALTDPAAGDPAGIAFDYNITQAGRLTAVIASLLPGQSGTVTFQVNVPSGVAPGVINDTASFSYNDGSSNVGPFNSNTVQFTVTQPPAVTLTGATVATATQGSTVSFTNVVTNTGYGTETFEMTVGTSSFPAGTTFRLVQPDGVTTLLDSNANGTPDTGPLAPGATYNVILRATLPAGATAVGSPFVVTKTARAASNPSVSASADDTLTTISNNSVDLTANLAGTLGAGPGPEASAIATLPGNPGATVRFTLNVKNNSAGADTFQLGSSPLTNFSTGLPVGWTVVFRNAANAVVTQTSVLNAGANEIIYADVTIPAGQSTGSQTVYFRAASSSTGAVDILHDAVTINSYRQLAFSAGNTGQIYPGGTVVYSHTLTNYGNVTEGDGTASIAALTAIDSTAGWNSVIYYDANGNGQIDVGEPVVTDTSFVSNGAAGLAPGETVRLLVKVFAPAGAVVGATDSVTLTATVTNGTNTGSAAPAIANDTSTVILSDIRLIKEQSLDTNGDGVADNAYSVANITTGAAPGAGICYRITVTNTGSQPALTVVVNDTTPTFTTYNSSTPAATSVGSVGSAPANGAAGVLTFNVGTLAPGASAVVTFAVRINQ